MLQTNTLLILPFQEMKGGKVVWEEYGEILREAGDTVREAKAQFQLSLARGVKDRRKGFSGYIVRKRNTRDNVGPLWKQKEDVTMPHQGNAEVLDDFCTSVFNSTCCSQCCPSGERQMQGLAEGRP